MTNLLTNANELVSTLTKLKIMLAPEIVGISGVLTILLTMLQKKRVSITFLYKIMSMCFSFFYSIYVYYVSIVSKVYKIVVNKGISGANIVANIGVFEVSKSNLISKL